MSSPTTGGPGLPVPPDPEGGADGSTRLGDRVFASISTGAGLVILLALAGVFVFLAVEGIPGVSQPAGTYAPLTSFWPYVGKLLFGTVLAAILALLIAVPFALGIALFISIYAPSRLAVPVAYVIDLLAAVPSVVFGIWGAFTLGGHLVTLYAWLDAHAGWIPLFAGPASVTGRTMFTAGVVLAIMILPIITAISREIFAQTPRLHREAAMALGATRWEMVRLTVFPYARSGVVSAIMLGLGRALGETMAVAIVLSASPVVTLNLISSTNPATIASNIASSFAEATPAKLHALIATGLALFALTFLVNFAARALVSRSQRNFSLSTAELAPDQRSTLSLTQASLPRWAEALVGVLALAVSGLLVMLAGWGVVAWVVIAALVFLVALPAWSFAVESRRSAIDRLMTTLVWMAFGVAVVPLVWMIGTVVKNGAGTVTGAFLTSDMRNVVGAGGGLYHALIGTLLITFAAAVISVPVGVMTAIYLVEYGKKNALARAVTFLVDVMTGIPSIVAGLFALSLFVLFFGPSFRFGFGGSVALALLMIPIVVRSTEEMLRLVPDDLREASYALGVPKWRTIVKIVLPTALGGIITGITLAVARVIGETAPLLVIAGTTSSTNYNLFDQRMATLPVYIYYQFTQPGIVPFNSPPGTQPPGIDRAWGAALVLIVLVLVLNLLARLVGRFFSVPTK